MAHGKRQLLLRYPTSLDVWQLGAAAAQPASAHPPAANTFLKLSQEPARLLQLKAKDDEWIVCAAVSSAGDYVAYATESGLYIYHFIQTNGGTLQLKKLVLPEGVSTTCHRMMFIHQQNRLLMATAELTVQLLDLTDAGGGGAKLVHTFDRENRLPIDDSIHLMDCSSGGGGGGHYAAVADNSGKVVVLDLKSLAVHSTLPRYQSHPTALAFHPASAVLVVAYADHKIVEYDVLARQYTPFSKKLSQQLPTQWLGRSCAVRHVTFDRRHPDVIILHDDSVIYTIDKNKVNSNCCRVRTR